MKKDKSKKTNNTDLRNKAEEILRPVSLPIEKQTDEEVRKLVHELQVHQIELEMQNEELRKAQIVIEESRRQYSHLFDSAPVGYFTISDKGIILQANLTGAEMLGVERSHLIGKPLGLFIMKEDEDIFYLERNRIFKTGSRGTCELRMKRKDGTQFYALLECTAVSTEDSTYCMTVMTDITVRKKADEILQKQKSDLEEKNIALSVVLGQIALEKQQIRDNVMSNVETLLLPIVQKLSLEAKSSKYVRLLRRNLQELTSSLGIKLAGKESKLTPKEAEICNMVKNSFTNKEIATLLCISSLTVQKHRINIRRKLGIINKGINLTSFLKTL